MQFVWIGFLKSDAQASPEVLHELTDFLKQPYISISSVGALRDEAGRRAAMLMIFDVEDRTAAEALVADSPFKRAGLYEHFHLLEFANEIG